MPQLAMTRLAVTVTDSQKVGLTRESHGQQANVVAQLVAQRVDGEPVIAHGHHVAVIADQVRLRA
eukprot:1037392-Pleurochrysis_carterae.AAC.1